MILRLRNGLPILFDRQTHCNPLEKVGEVQFEFL